MARLVVDLVVLAQEAGVVVGYLLAQLVLELELAPIEQLGYQLGVVLHREGQLTVFIVEGVEAMGRHGNHAPGLEVLEHLMILLDHGLKALALADPLDLVTAAELVHAHGAKVQSHPLEHRCQGTGDWLDAGVIGG
jgi:hypothetical protein